MERGCLFAVADGMGGHAGGDVASRMACRGLQAYYQRPLPIKQRGKARSLSDCLCATVLRIDRQIRRRGRADPELADMGTTLSCLVLADAGSIIAHVGDSRIYRLRRGCLTCLTTDHTFVRDMVFEGVIAPDKAAGHPMRHLLTNSVGTGEVLEWVDARIDPVRAGDRFLLCTDGLHSMVPAKRIAEMLGGVRRPPKIARDLVEEALTAGGKDNVSAVVVFLNGAT